MPKEDGGSDLLPSRLMVKTVGDGFRLYHMYRTCFPDPLGFGHGPSRFSDPSVPPSYGVVYFALDFKTCLAEAPARRLFPPSPDAAEAAELLAALSAYACAKAVVSRPLHLLDLRTAGAPIHNAMPLGITGPDDKHQAQGRDYARRVHAHPDGVDGLLYPSVRMTFAPLGRAGTCIALFDRALPKLRIQRCGALETSWPADLATSLRNLGLA